MGRLDKHLTILTDSLKRAVEVPVRMRVFEELEIEPREASVRLWGVVGGQAERASLVVKARGGRGPQPLDLTVKTVRGLFGRPSGTYLRASVEPAPEGKRITIELDPRHPEGPISAEVEASLDGRALVIPVSGEMFAWIKISPNYLNFSRIEAADPASSYREVLLTATDDTPFRVTGISTRPYRAGEKTVELQIEALAAPAGAPGEKSLPAAAPRRPGRDLPTGSGGGRQLHGEARLPRHPWNGDGALLLRDGDRAHRPPQETGDRHQVLRFLRRCREARMKCCRSRRPARPGVKNC